MLGYFRPTMQVLTKGDEGYYRNHYCTLCHYIQKRYGPASTLFLQHDLIFFLLTLEHEALDLDNCRTAAKRCVLNPLKKINILDEEDLFAGLADLAVFVVRVCGKWMASFSCEIEYF